MKRHDFITSISQVTKDSKRSEIEIVSSTKGVANANQFIIVTFTKLLFTMIEVTDTFTEHCGTEVNNSTVYSK